MEPIGTNAEGGKVYGPGSIEEEIKNLGLAEHVKGHAGLNEKDRSDIAGYVRRKLRELGSSIKRRRTVMEREFKEKFSTLEEAAEFIKAYIQPKKEGE